jgi:hypothetical protein
MQFALQEIPSIPDADTAILLLHFYKLLFMGTPFSTKMLKLQVEIAKGARAAKMAGKNLQAKIEEAKAEEDDD